MIGNPFLLTSNNTWLLLQLPEVFTVKWTEVAVWAVVGDQTGLERVQATLVGEEGEGTGEGVIDGEGEGMMEGVTDGETTGLGEGDRKSTRLNSSHQIISYAVFCLKKKKKKK